MFLHSILFFSLLLGAVSSLFSQLLPFQEKSQWGLCDTAGVRLVYGGDSVVTGKYACALWKNGKATLWHATRKVAVLQHLTGFRELDSVVAIRTGTQWRFLSVPDLRETSTYQYNGFTTQEHVIIASTEGGSVICTPSGRYIMPTQPGRYAVAVRSGWVQWSGPDGRFGLARPGGTLIPDFYRAFLFAAPFIWADSGGRWVLYSNTGKRLQPASFDAPALPEDGFCMAVQNGRTGILNIAGEWALQPDFQQIERYGDIVRYCLPAPGSTWQQHSLRPGNTRRALLLGDPDPQTTLLTPVTGRSQWTDPGYDQDSMLLIPLYGGIDSMAIREAQFPSGSWQTQVNAIRGTYLKLVQAQVGNPGESRKIYGLFNHHDIAPILPVVLTEVCYEDFIADTIARCLTHTGRHLWITAHGRIIRPVARITQPVRNGVAPACADCRVATPHQHRTYTNSYTCEGQLLSSIPRYWKDRYQQATFTQGKWGLADHNGQWLVPARYDAIGYPSGGFAAIMLDGRAGVLEIATGKVSWLPMKTITPLPGIPELFVTSDSSFRFKVFLPETGEEAVVTGSAIGTPEGRLIPVKSGGKWGIKRPDNTWLVSPQFDDLGRFSGELAPVRKGIWWGYLSRRGDLRIPCQYIVASGFWQGLAVVRTSTRYGVIDSTGTWVVEPIFQRVTAVRDSLMIAGGNSRYGLFTLSGRPVIPAQYRSLVFCDEGVRLFDGEKYGYAQRDGTIVCTPRFFRAGPMTRQGAICASGDTYYQLLPDGRISQLSGPMAIPPIQESPPLAALHQASVRGGTLLLNLYHARQGMWLVQEVTGIRGGGKRICISGPDWSGWLRPNGSWLIHPQETIPHNTQTSSLSTH